MDTADVENAVRLVLPALNLEPAQFRLDRGFLARALRSDRPRATALDGVRTQFVFLGVRAAAEPEAVAREFAAEALGSLSDASRAVCEGLAVGWAHPDGRVFAAAFAVLPGGRIGPPLGVSWRPPDTWTEPMIDTTVPGDEALDQALARLERIVSERGARSDPAFEQRLERALRLVDLTLRRSGGEGQSSAARPSAGAPDESWRGWFRRYDRSIRDEWRRVGGQVEASGAPTLPASGPLHGVRVFLSYTRPDAATLALPVFEALRSCGATVWFDQEEAPDESRLDTGFADIIGDCDAYVMCASDEFVERAGYATQEFAWAVQQRESGGRPRHLVVVTRPDTILPSAVARWPVIELRDDDSRELARALTLHLRHTTLPTLPAAPVDPLPPQIAPGTLPPLPPQVDLPALWRRVQHVRLFEAISQAAVDRLVSDGEIDRSTEEARRRLLQLGDGLGWTGGFGDFALWPDDSLIRDIRVRFAGARAVVGARWPLEGSLTSTNPGVDDDVEFLVTTPVPQIEWPAVVGWDDGERRLALRYHVGTLRCLQELLRRGLTAGLHRVPSSTLDAWEHELSARRRECYDALLALRLGGRLDWQRDPPTWDGFFRAWSKLFTRGGRPWRDPLPFAVHRMLSGNVDEVAAVAAETGWYVSRYGGLAAQSFTPRGVEVPAILEVYASSSGAIDTRNTTNTENCLRLGLVAQGDGAAELRISWRGPLFSQDAGPGRITGHAPDQLRRAIAWRRS